MRTSQLQTDLIQQLQRFEAWSFRSFWLGLLRFLQRAEVDRAGLNLPGQATCLFLLEHDLVRANGDHIAAMQGDGRRNFLFVDEGPVYRSAVAKRCALFRIPLDDGMAAGHSQLAIGENYVVVAGPAQR